MTLEDYSRLGRSVTNLPCAVLKINAYEVVIKVRGAVTEEQASEIRRQAPVTVKVHVEENWS